MSDFIKISKMVPKSYYLHYYIFFLYYALYYHNHRAYVDVIDKSRTTNHINRMLSIKCQLKYLQYKIKQSIVFGNGAHFLRVTAGVCRSHPKFHSALNWAEC